MNFQVGMFLFLLKIYLIFLINGALHQDLDTSISKQLRMGFINSEYFSGGQVIFEQSIPDAKENKRAFVLLGLGSAYKLKPELEAYANFSQNFRSINFTDLAVVNPNLIVDSLLEDESGFNFDLGIRGSVLDGAIRFDASLFYLKYKDRIGITEIIVPDPAVIERAVAYRTNIGDARIIGLETYIEAELLQLIYKKKNEKVWLDCVFSTLVYCMDNT